MTRRHLRHHGVYATVSLAIAATITGAVAATPRAPVAAAPGEGLICSAMFLVVAAEVGRRCFPGENIAVHDELGRSIARIDNFVLSNSATTPAQLAEFKRRQGGAALANNALCGGDRLALYRSIVTRGPAAIRADTARLVSQPGKPTWGNCL